ncbi:MAG TPA: hypothetical protein VG916_05000 [Gemmatimonadaceae bacterium]|nr:hypothetical protein [Gemmatimonadaceae bacterium]
MRRIVLLSCVLAACRTVQVGGNASGPGVGAPSATAAVEQMLAAARAQDLQAITAVWGDEKGLMRDRTPRDELESRAYIIACVLKSDSQKVGRPAPAGNGHVFVTADLTQGKNAGSIRFEVAPSGGGRWLVTNFDVSVLQNKGFCSRPGE